MCSVLFMYCTLLLFTFKCSNAHCHLKSICWIFLAAEATTIQDYYSALILQLFKSLFCFLRLCNTECIHVVQVMAVFNFGDKME